MMLLEIKNLVKTFPGVKALQKANFQLEEGEIHALLGGNGAGKSTLIKVLAGMYNKDSGIISYQGSHFDAPSPQQAEISGICTVFQEVNLLPNLTVAENIYMERQPRTMGLINWKEINRKSVELLKMFDLTIDVTRELGEFSVAVQQMIAIARAMAFDPKILILDEPTSSLNEREASLLFRELKRLREAGCTIVIITHFLEQVYELCDRITVLRDGASAGTWSVQDLPLNELKILISGKAAADAQSDINDSIGTNAGIVSSNEQSDYLMKLPDLGVIRLGSILKSGSTVVENCIFSFCGSDNKKIEVRHDCVIIRNPELALRNSLSLGVKEDNNVGQMGKLSVLQSITLALGVKRGWFSLMDGEEQNDYARKYLEGFSLVGSVLEENMDSLSEAEFEVVSLAKAIASDPSLLAVSQTDEGGSLSLSTEQKFVLKLTPEGLSIIVFSEVFLSQADKYDSVLIK